MKITHDPEVDVLRVVFSSMQIEENDEDKPGVILDCGKDGNSIGLRILKASTRVANPRSVEYTVAGQTVGVFILAMPVLEYPEVFALKWHAGCQRGSSMSHLSQMMVLDFSTDSLKTGFLNGLSTVRSTSRLNMVSRRSFSSKYLSKKSIFCGDRSKFVRYCRPKKGEAFCEKVFAYTFDFRPTSLYVDHGKQYG